MPEAKFLAVDYSFSVEPAHIAQIAHESVDGDRIELKSYIDMCDPVIYQIGRWISRF